LVWKGEGSCGFSDLPREVLRPFRQKGEVKLFTKLRWNYREAIILAMDNLADLTFLGAGVPEGKFWTVGGKRRRFSDQMSSLPRNVVLTWKERTFSQF